MLRPRTLAAAVLTAAVLAVVLVQARPGPVLDALVEASPWWIAAAAAAALAFNTLQSAEVLRWCLRGFGVRIPYAKALAATAGNMAIKAALPAQTGEIARVAWLQRSCGVEPLRSTAAIASLLWFKVAALVAMAAAGLAAMAFEPRWLCTVVILLAAGTACVPVVLLCTGRSSVRADAAGWRRVPAAAAAAVSSAEPLPLAAGAALAAVSVGAEVAVFAMILVGLGGDADLPRILAFVPLVILGAKVPLTILGLGTREALVVVLLAGSGSSATLAAAGLSFSALEYLLPALAGLAFTWSYVRRIVGAG